MTPRRVGKGFTWNIMADFERLLVEALPEAGVYAVGGSVRDAVLAELGKPQPNAPDLDYLVTGLPLETLLERLRPLGRAEVVGASFGVIKFSRDDATVDIALPRRERSTGPHHRDFEIQSAPDIPIEEDLGRRDFRINMMARDVRTGAIVDPTAAGPTSRPAGWTCCASRPSKRTRCGSCAGPNSRPVSSSCRRPQPSQPCGMQPTRCPAWRPSGSPTSWPNCSPWRSGRAWVSSCCATPGR